MTRACLTLTKEDHILEQKPFRSSLFLTHCPSHRLQLLSTAPVVTTNHPDPMRGFQKNITETQDNVTRKMSSLCPGFAPSRTYLTDISGEG